MKLATMPNLIHSLDASAIALLAKHFINASTTKNIYTIHDCFGIFAKDAFSLLEMLKTVYAEIYYK